MSDIVARVFNLKRKELLKDFKEKDFSEDIHAKEFQKRGILHAHNLIIVAHNDKPKSVDDIDKLVQAEIPNKSRYSKAHDIVLKSMIHRPCGDSNPQSLCMENGVCTKNYPKSFFSEITIDNHGYVQYHRRDDGQRYVINERKIVNNRWVVPYNKDLLNSYNAHINVEICAHPQLLKYLYKYIHKGHDRSTIVIEDNCNQQGGFQQQYKEVVEVKNIWIVSKFPLLKNVGEYLNFHYTIITISSTNKQNILFDEIELSQDVIARPDIKKTKLSWWSEEN